MNPFDFRFIGSAGEYIKEFWGNEYTASIAQVIPCPLCLGKGSYAAAESEDDFISTHCDACNGNGQIMASYI